jgi:hypothetical protein
MPTEEQGGILGDIEADWTFVGVKLLQAFDDLDIELCSISHQSFRI